MLSRDDMPLNRLQKTRRSTCRFAAVAAIIRHRCEPGAKDSLRRLRRPQSLAALALPQRTGALPAQVRILGLDPGSLRTGYAIIETQATRLAYIASGAIRTRGESLTERLQEIFAGVESLASEFRPDEVAIERVFMHRNADSALKLG